MRKWLGIAGLVVMGVVATGCNTVQGFGKDVEKAGEAIQKSAK